MAEANTTRRTESSRALDLAAVRTEAADRTRSARVPARAGTADPRASISRVPGRLTAVVRDGARGGAGGSVPGNGPAGAALRQAVAAADGAKPLPLPAVRDAFRWVPAGAVPQAADEPIGPRSTPRAANGTPQHGWPRPEGGQPAPEPPRTVAPTPTVEDALHAEPAVTEPAPCSEPGREVTPSVAPLPHPGAAAATYRRPMPGAVRGGEPAGRAGRVTPIAASAPRIGLDPHPADAQVPLPHGWYRGSTGLPLDREDTGAASLPAWSGTWLERPTGPWPEQDEEGVTHVG